MKRLWLIELDEEVNPHEKYGTASFSEFQKYEAFKNAKEAMRVIVPEGFEFSGILEKDGEKSDWERIELFAIKQPRPAAGTEKEGA